MYTHYVCSILFSPPKDSVTPAMRNRIETREVNLINEQELVRLFQIHTRQGKKFLWYRALNNLEPISLSFHRNITSKSDENSASPLGIPGLCITRNRVESQLSLQRCSIAVTRARCNVVKYRIGLLIEQQRLQASVFQ